MHSFLQKIGKSYSGLEHCYVVGKPSNDRELRKKYHILNG